MHSRAEASGVLFGQHPKHLAPARKALQFEQADAGELPMRRPSREDARDLFAAKHVVPQGKLLGRDRIQRRRERGARDLLEPEGHRNVRSLAVIWYDIDLAQMDRTSQVQRALFGNLPVPHKYSTKQLEHRLDGADGGHLGGLRVVEREKIAVAGAPHTTEPADPANLTDQG